MEDDKGGCLGSSERSERYGPPLPAGVLDDDGNFTGLGREKDLLTGDNDGTGAFTIPQYPVRRRLHGVERFVITRGGEYFFLPSLSALRWLADGK
ncbi:hypothetical protein [Streptomyces sp. NPDC097610]|uniref:hypothetical protein n=1 Tax=Streptomyces sp. NPDC097610 TaxID=3157227 RepID=UPI0033180FFF